MSRSPSLLVSPDTNTIGTTGFGASSRGSVTTTDPSGTLPGLVTVNVYVIVSPGSVH